MLACARRAILRPRSHALTRNLPNILPTASFSSDSNTESGENDEFLPIESMNEVLPATNEFLSTGLEEQIDPIVEPLILDPDRWATPVWMAEQVIESFHTHPGTMFPWWGAVIATTLSARFLLFPLFFRGQRVTGILQSLKPKAEEATAEMKKLQAQGASKEKQAAAMKKVTKIYSDAGVSPFSPFVTMIASGPVFLGCFLACRGMPELYPSMMEGGGALWFPTIGIPDPKYMLPLLSSVTMMGTMELNMKLNPAAQQGPFAKYFTWFARGSAVVMFPIGCQLPSTCLLYWITNNTFMAAQSLLFANPGFRKLSNLPDMPKPVASATETNAPQSPLQAFQWGAVPKKQDETPVLQNETPVHQDETPVRRSRVAKKGQKQKRKKR